MNDQNGADLLSGLLEDVSVEQLDAKLMKLGRDWRRYYAIRKLIAAEQGITTPPPMPPTIDGHDMVVLAPEKSALTWRMLAETFKTHEESPYHRVKFATRNFYDSLLKRLVEDLGDNKLAAAQAADIFGIHERWMLIGKLPMAKALTGMARSLINFGANTLNDPECQRLAVPFHRMRQLSEERRTGPVELTEDHARAVIEQAHKMELASIAFAQAIQFYCSLSQKEVIGEWIPVGDPGESAIIDGDMKWVRGIQWSNIDRSLTLRHHAGRSQEMRVIDLRPFPAVLDELYRFNPRPTSGPLIVYEHTKKPYRAQQFRRLWRQIADEVGIPKNVKNMESRFAKTDNSEEGA
jgi:hypothetical protein